MGFFTKKRAPKPAPNVVIDVGFPLTRLLVFERTGFDVPKVLKKEAHESPYDAARTVAKLHTLLFDTVTRLGRVPEKITIALGPHFAGYQLLDWAAKPNAKQGKFTAAELGGIFQNLFEEHREAHAAMLAQPLEIRANGYKINQKALLTVERKIIDEVAFRTLVLRFPEEIGASLVELKQSLGGMPVEFVSRVAVYPDWISRLDHVEDALLIDIGGQDTLLTLLREGAIAGIEVMSMGGCHFVSWVARITERTIEKAHHVTAGCYQGLHGGEVRTKTQEVFKQQAEAWKKLFIEALDSFYTLGPLPQRVYLFGTVAQFPEISEVVRASDWIRNFSYFDTPEVRLIEAPAIFEGDTLGGALQGPEEVGLAALIYWTIHHEPLL